MQKEMQIPNKTYTKIIYFDLSNSFNLIFISYFSQAENTHNPIARKVQKSLS